MGSRLNINSNDKSDGIDKSEVQKIIKKLAHLYLNLSILCLCFIPIYQTWPWGALVILYKRLLDDMLYCLRLVVTYIVRNTVKFW